MNDEMIQVSKHDLYRLLDSGSDWGCEDTIVVDREPYMKLHKMFQERFGIHCGYISEDEE